MCVVEYLSVVAKCCVRLGAAGNTSGILASVKPGVSFSYCERGKMSYRNVNKVKIVTISTYSLQLLILNLQKFIHV